MTPGADAARPPFAGVLFSPSQLQRLEELRSQAPLLYPSQQPAAGLQPAPGRAQVEAQQPVTPQSSASCSAEAIQAEVRRQLASMNQAHELRIRELEEENRRLRQGFEAPMVSKLGGVLSGFLGGLGLAPAPQRASTQDPLKPSTLRLVCRATTRSVHLLHLLLYFSIPRCRHMGLWSNILRSLQRISNCKVPCSFRDVTLA